MSRDGVAGWCAAVVLAAACGPAVAQAPQDAAHVRLVESEQVGCRRVDFRLGPQRFRAFLLLPKRAAAEAAAKKFGARPWVWYAPVLRGGRGGWRYPNRWHEWYFRRFLDAGFAVGGADVGESWGNPAGREQFSRFYAFVVRRFGLSPRACLFAESRGALMLYNWAVEHPESVQCIGALYPVCKITLGPFFARVYGLARRKTKPAEWRALSASEQARRNLAELRAEFKQHNPLDRLAPLAKAKVPILHLHGGRDALVPWDAHSGELARRYARLGGTARVLVMSNNRHEPALEFFRNRRFLQFFLHLGHPPRKLAEPAETPLDPPAGPKPDEPGTRPKKDPPGRP